LAGLVLALEVPVEPAGCELAALTFVGVGVVPEEQDDSAIRLARTSAATAKARNIITPYEKDVGY
jgi:hypothetical protein